MHINIKIQLIIYLMFLNLRLTFIYHSISMIPSQILRDKLPPFKIFINKMFKTTAP